MLRMLSIALLILMLMACSANDPVTVEPQPLPATSVPTLDVVSVETPPSLSEPSSTNTPQPTPSSVEAERVVFATTAPAEEEAVPTATMSPVHEIASPTPIGPPVGGSEPCQRPPDDAARVDFNGHILNARTLWMLHLADAVYTGRGDPLRVTQGSYTEGEDLSFGTHSGGGAVDISIRVKSNPDEILSLDEAGELVLALRQAGFGAWLRLPEDLTPGVPLHIHAIAVGDPELSPPALQQLVGPEGYFRGLDGVPPEYGGPHPDRYGGPILCRWMVEMGFSDLRE